MISDVTIPAALIAGIVSFLSPCVLPLVPPYLIYLTGATIEHVANDEQEAASRRAVMISAAVFVLGFSTVFVALGASASLVGSVVRSYAAELSIVAGILIILMGLHFLGLDAHRAADARGTPEHAQAGWPVGRLCDGSGFRVWLDAVHRTYPCGDPVGGGGRSNGDQGRRDCSRFIPSASASRS